MQAPVTRTQAIVTLSHGFHGGVVACRSSLNVIFAWRGPSKIVSLHSSAVLAPLLPPGVLVPGMGKTLLQLPPRGRLQALCSHFNGDLSFLKRQVEKQARLPRNGGS
jgi:hypothetical protein